jgi:hypothetical protein
MTQGRGNKANDLLQPNFRDASGSPPNLGNAPVGHAPAPSTVRQAHLFDERGLKLVLGSTARPVFTREELAKFNAVLRGEYP